MSIEAMKQALDFLEWFAGDDHSIRPKHKAPEIAAALRQAIEFEEMVKKGTKAWAGTPDDWVDDLRGGAEKQEPVAFRNTETGEFCTGGFLRKDWAKWQPLYTAPVHASDMSQERVDETAKDQLVPDGMIPISNGGIATSTPTDFFAPPKREWVGLTDEDIDLYAFDIGVTDNKAPAWLVTYARGIEAKLKEKNT